MAFSSKEVEALAHRLRRVLTNPGNIHRTKLAIDEVKDILNDRNCNTEVLTYCGHHTDRHPKNHGKNALHLVVDMACDIPGSFYVEQGAQIAAAILNSPHCTKEVFSNDQMTRFGNPLFYAVATKQSSDSQHDLFSKMIHSPNCPEGVITEEHTLAIECLGGKTRPNNLIKQIFEKGNSAVLEALIKSGRLTEQAFYAINDTNQFTLSCLSNRDLFPCLSVLHSYFPGCRGWSASFVGCKYLESPAASAKDKLTYHHTMILDQLFDLEMNDIRRSPWLNMDEKQDDTVLRFERVARNTYRHADMLEKYNIVDAMRDASRRLRADNNYLYEPCSTEYYQEYYTLAKPLAQTLAAIVCLGVLVASVAVAVATLGVAAIPMVAPLCAALGSKALGAAAIAGVASTFGALKCTQFAARHVRENQFARELEATIARKAGVRV